MKDRAILTIVIPVYNRERLVLSALESVAAQDCNDRIKVIVVDDNSTDSTFGVVKDWIACHNEMDVTLLKTSVKGSSGARNRGLADVTTEFTMFFDSDDRIMPGFLKEIAKCLEATDADIVGWDVRFTGRGKKKRIFSAENVWMNHLVHGVLSTQRYVAKTSLFRAAGGWNEKLECWTDYELGVRILSLNPNIEKNGLAHSRTIEVNYTPESITGHGPAERPEKWIVSLDTVENTLKAVSPENLGWLQYRRAILAAELSLGGAGDYASEQLKKALAGDKIPAYAVEIIYRFHRWLRRGTWFIASIYC